MDAGEEENKENQTAHLVLKEASAPRHTDLIRADSAETPAELHLKNKDKEWSESVFGWVHPQTEKQDQTKRKETFEATFTLMQEGV